MEITLALPNNPFNFTFTWIGNHEIKVDLGHDGVIITANKDGLISLAAQLLTLAQDDYEHGYDFHLDKYAGLEDDSIDLIVVKTAK